MYSNHPSGLRYCPLISHYPLWFKSIINYLHKCSSYPVTEVDRTEQVEICLAKGFSVTQGENCPPTIATYWPISVSLGSWHSILQHREGTSFFSTALLLSLTNTSNPHIETQVFIHNFSATLLLRDQCLISDYIYGEEKGSRVVKYAHMSRTWMRGWYLLINNGTGSRTRPLASHLCSFPFSTSELCIYMTASIEVVHIHICVRGCTRACFSPSEKQPVEKPAFI